VPARRARAPARAAPAALPAGDAVAQPFAAATAAAAAAASDNSCHCCSEPGELLECDACPRSWHRDCLPPAPAALAAALLEADPWLCPVCTRTPRPATFVGNPQRAPPGRGGGQHRARLRPAAEGTKR
jgi:hypothetical protein